MQRLRTTTPRLTMHGYGVGFQTRLYIAPSVSLPGLSFTVPSVAMPSCITSSGKVGTATSKMICGYAVPQAAQLQVAQRTSRTLSFPVQTSFRLLTGSSTLGQPWQVWTDHPLSLLIHLFILSTGRRHPTSSYLHNLWDLFHRVRLVSLIKTDPKFV